MLFGSKEQQNFVLSKAHKYAQDMDVRLIFGAVIGSISRGIQYADSDYDVRFLYLRKDFPEKICLPFQMTEDELVKRYRLDNQALEVIPLWEATSFLQFLLEPRFTDVTSDGLYTIVGWTFQSPYIWDPYGLQGRLMPLVNRIFRKKYVISYYKNELEKYRADLSQETAISKNYLYAVHAAATIEWCTKYMDCPPVDIGTLLCGLGRVAVWNEVKKILDQARRETRQAWNSSVSKHEFVHFAHTAILTPRNSFLLEYIDGAIYQSDLEETKGKTNNFVEKPEEVIGHMYEIIYRNVFKNEKLYCSFNLDEQNGCVE